MLTFVLPLAEPQPLSGQTYTFSTYDPTYFVDMSYASESDATLPDAVQKTCKLTVKTPKPGKMC